MRRDDFYDGHMNNGLGWFIALMLVLLVLAAIAALVVYLTTRGKPSSPPPAASSNEESSARRILDERLARGEIAPDEYRERRQALDS
jgi:putative membrane protein